MNNATFDMFNLPRPHILNTKKQDLIVDAQTLSAPVRLPKSKQKSSQMPISEKIPTSSISISSNKPICGTTAISKLDIIATLANSTSSITPIPQSARSTHAKHTTTTILRQVLPVFASTQPSFSSLPPIPKLIPITHASQTTTNIPTHYSSVSAATQPPITSLPPVPKLIPITHTSQTTTNFYTISISLCSYTATYASFNPYTRTDSNNL